MVDKKRILEFLPLLNERELTLIWRDIRRAADVYAIEDNDKAWNDCLDLENAIENECEKRFGSRPASYKSLEGANELPGIYKKIYSIQRKARGEMTYGVYSRDLKYTSITERSSVDSAKKWCCGDSVVCSEKKFWCGWSITFHFHKWNEIIVSPKCGIWRLGFLEIKCQTHRYTWADKIVYDPKKKER